MNGREPWSDLARRVKEEEDPEKLLQLCRQLDEAMLQEERRKIKLKLEKKRNTPLQQAKNEKE
jgi:hypothetical protein